VSFTLGTILGRVTRQELRAVAEPEVVCPLGKTAFPSKRAAREAHKAHRGDHTPMTAFRCDFCSKYHLGHRRGAVL